MRNEPLKKRAEELRNLVKIYPDSKSAKDMKALAKTFEKIDKLNHEEAPAQNRWN